MSTGVSIVTLDVLIEAAVNRQPYNNQRLGREVERYARRVSLARARHLPEDLHGEIAQEAIANLFAAMPDTLLRTTPRKLLRNAVFAAIRTVQANNAPPGKRTRSSSEPAHDRVAPGDIARIPSAKTLEAATVREGDHAVIDIDRLSCPSAWAAIQAVEDRIDVACLMAHASPLVSKALRLIHLDDQPTSDVALEAKISRFALNRQIERFCLPWRVAA